MIRVLNIIDTGGPGGAETVFLHTATGLDPTRFQSICMVSRDGWLADGLRARGVTPLIIPSSGSLNVGYLRQILRVARAERIDLIVGHLYGSAVYGSLAGRLLRLPVVSVLHGQSDIGPGGRFQSLKKLLVRIGSRRMVFVSDRLKQTLQPVLGVADNQCTVIPNGVDVARFSGNSARPLRRELGLQTDEILVGAVGNIRHAKSYEVLLHAAHLLKQRSPRYRFAIAGEGSGALYEQLLSLRRKLGLERELTFLGLRSDIADILQSLDVYALCSTTEGFSIACIEAMAAGAPVVATRSGGPEEIIEHERSGLLVPTQNAQALADAIHALAANPDASKPLIAQARQRVEARYTLSAMIRSYEQLFTYVTSGNSQ